MSTDLRAVDIIAAKRNGNALSSEEISRFIQGYACGDIPDYQAAAWCMAVYLNGMTAQETGALTRAMIHSGTVIDLSSIPGPFVDKHSTGGVGDKISLVLAPIAAACGVKVPMMSGRALGFTGGTLDKLDAIPGYSTDMSQEQFVKTIASAGYAMTGQSEKIVPADRKLYALRDVTGTVESIPLITGSILSKKIAEGAESLIMDVKCGSGAFMKTIPEALALAESLVATGKNLGCRVIAVISDMSEPLGRKVGNFLEIEEAVDCLTGKGPEDVMEVTCRLTAWMLAAAGIENNLSKAEALCMASIHDGRAIEKFRRNVELQGGRLNELDSMLGTARAAFSREISAQSSGWITGVDALSIGRAGVSLGIGRSTSDDSVEALAGIEILKKTGDAVAKGETLLRLWAAEKWRLDSVDLETAVSIGQSAPASRKSLILKEISEEFTH